MKHHCHCGLEKHLQHFRIKRVGVLGVVLMGLHIAFHIVECLVLPAVLVSLGGHAVEEQAAATSKSMQIIDEKEERFLTNTTCREVLMGFEQSLQIGDTLRLQFQGCQ